MPDTEQIKSLIRRKFAGDLSNQESSLLDELLANDPELKSLHNRIEEEYFSSTAQNSLTDLKNSFDNIKERAAEEKDRIFEETKARRIRVWRVSTAAAALLIFVGGLFWWQSNRTDNNTSIVKSSGSNVKLVLPSGEEVDLSNSVNKQVGNVMVNSNSQKLTYSLGTDGAKGTATLIVPDGKDFSVMLSDGTEIQLNSGSSLTFPFSFSETSREVTINGEAFLKVAKLPSKPFRVRLKTSTEQAMESPIIQVLGTEFNVNTFTTSKIQVALLEGSVKIISGNDSLRLKPGYQAVLQKGLPIKTETFDREEVLAWRTGVMEFKGVPLQEVVAAIPRWYGRQVVIDNSALGSKLFTGALDRRRPVTYFLENLEFTHGIKYLEKDGVFHIVLAE